MKKEEIGKMNQYGNSGNAGVFLPEGDFKNEKKLYFDVTNGPGIRIEKTDRFLESYFRDNYYDVLVLTGRIIEENEKFRKDAEFAESSQYRLYNIISFLGGRGTGKTSVMDSAVLALRDDKQRAEYVKFAEDYQKLFGWDQTESGGKGFASIKDADFICLDEIDASLLEKKENILDVVLAKMLQLFQKETAFSRKSYWNLENVSYRKEDVYVAFEEIYHYWHNLLDRSDASKKSSGSTLEVMRELSGSLHIREKLASLVQYYIRAVKDQFIPENRVYLLIRIDDLDLNPDCYEMLEQIHRYLMIPGIIIYFAASPRELQDLCQNHYKDRYSRAEELATDYLDKVLTTSRRIYMPTLVSENVFINPDEEDVKKTILWKIGRRTRVFFDGCGYKKHFYEESNLRSLLNLYYEFDSMDKLDFDRYRLKNAEERKKYMFAFERNIDKLYDDVTKRMAMEKLSNSEESKFFQNYCLEDSARRGRYFIEWLEERHPDRQIENDYNYGELMRSIYQFGREDKSLKPLIHCILAEYSVTLTNLYYRMLFSDSEQNRKRYRNKFLECISGSVIGSWANKLLPQVQRTSMTDITSIGYEDAFSLNGTLLLEDFGIQYKRSISRYEQSKEILESTSLNFVQTIELMGMFLTKIQKGIGTSQSLLSLEDIGNGLVDKLTYAPLLRYAAQPSSIQLRLSPRTCTFDILGFVLVGIRYEEYFKKVENYLMEMFVIYWKDSQEVISKNQEEEFRSLIQQKSLRGEYEKWARNYYGLALPVYSLDMMYNITKRVKNEMKRKRIGDDYEDDILNSIKNCYELYLENLEKETDYFSRLRNSDNKKSCDVDFSNAFKECPFYYHFTKDIERNTFLRAVFKEILWGDIGQSSPADTTSSMEETVLDDANSSMEGLI